MAIKVSRILLIFPRSYSAKRSSVIVYRQRFAVAEIIKELHTSMIQVQMYRLKA